MPEPVMLLKDVRVEFPRSGQAVIAPVRAVSLSTLPGRTLGLVGESGSGKSLTAQAILGLVPYPGRVLGSILFQGRELVGLEEKEYERLRGAGISIVFQDPATALNPVLTIGEQLIETIRYHKGGAPQEAREAALRSLRQVDLSDPEARLRAYPHQLSGGMKQRVLIAMALACDPSLLILDEPTTALDVTVQAQILDLIELIQSSNQCSILLISHDLAVVSEVADDISIIYAGRIVEHARTSELLSHPRHPYTRGLLNSIPALGRHKCPLLGIPGSPPDPAELPAGCPFHPRCPRAQAICEKEDPPLTVATVAAHACWDPEPGP